MRLRCVELLSEWFSCKKHRTDRALCKWSGEFSGTLNRHPLDGPVFGDRCILCMRCLHHCPAQAIQIASWTRNKYRYPGPGPDSFRPARLSPPPECPPADILDYVFSRPPAILQVSQIGLDGFTGPIQTGSRNHESPPIRVHLCPFVVKNGLSLCLLGAETISQKRHSDPTARTINAIMSHFYAHASHFITHRNSCILITRN